jgi:preprotein translocase subunit SecG
MEILTTLLYILFAFVSLILVLVVLIQDEGGEGMGGMFGGGSTTPFGSRSGNVLTRFTSIVAGIFLIICIGIGLLSKSPEIESSVNLGGAKAEEPPLFQSTETGSEKAGAGQELFGKGQLAPLSPESVVDQIIKDEKKE